jgi:enamine deaminase RidA (YjgF/YER057c/UK114 family)
MNAMKKYVVSALAVALCTSLAGNAAVAKTTKIKAKAPVPVAKALEPITHTYAKPDSFIATSVVVPKGYKTIYLSGALPDVADPNAPKGSIASYGNTETQAESVFQKLEAALKAEGAGPGDVVSMRVFLLGDPALDGKMDFAGMMNAYKRHYGTPEQPNRPVRATVQVAGLAGPGFLVEIEVTAAVSAK